MTSKKILIVGGTGAIGSALAHKINKKGYSPIIISRNEDDLKIISERIKCEYFVCDVLDTNKLSEIVRSIGDNLHGIAYCAGTIDLKPLKAAKESEFIESFKINTLGAISAIKAGQISLIKNNGSILLFSTIAVKQGFINHSIISTSKGAIEGLTLSLAAELSPNVRVNCIAPSLTNAKMSQKLINNENIKKAIESMHPIPRIGEGSDFSEIGSYLLSNENKWITGQILHIDGGRSTLRIKS